MKGLTLHCDINGLQRVQSGHASSGNRSGRLLRRLSHSQLLKLLCHASDTTLSRGLISGLRIVLLWLTVCWLLSSWLSVRVTVGSLLWVAGRLISSGLLVSLLRGLLTRESVAWCYRSSSAICWCTRCLRSSCTICSSAVIESLSSVRSLFLCSCWGWRGRLCTIVLLSISLSILCLILVTLWRVSLWVGHDAGVRLTGAVQRSYAVLGLLFVDAIVDHPGIKTAC